MIKTRIKTFWRFLVFVYQSFMQNDGLETAKSLTYTSLFAVVPLVTLLLSILAAFPSFQVFGDQIQNMLFERLLPSTGSEIQGYITSFAEQARNLTWIGAVMLLVTSFLMLRNVEACFNLIWGVRDLRKGLSSFLLYWSVLSLGPLLLGMGFAISSYVTSLTLFEKFITMPDFFGARSAVLQMFPIALTTGAFTLLYVAVPNCGVRLRYALIGAIIVALSFTVVKWVFTTSIATASYELVYGTFAALPIFLLWLYVCWVVILVGANLVRCIPIFIASHNSAEVHPTLLLLALLHCLWERQQHGEPLRVRTLQDQAWPFKGMQAGKLLSMLEDMHLVRSLERDEYMLTRDLDSVSLWDVLTQIPWAAPKPDELKHPLPTLIAQNLPGSDLLKARFLRMADASNHEFSQSLSAYFRQEP
jgi:membrane protein